MSLAELIMSNRRYRRLTGYGLTFNVFVIAGLYLQLIYPVFLPQEVTNPAFIKFVGSSEYRTMSEYSKRALRAYNSSPEKDESALPGDYYAVDPSQFGLVVRVALKSVPLAANAGIASGAATPAPRYKYTQEIAVVPSAPVLIGFLTLEFALILWIAYLFMYRAPDARLKFEEEILRRYFSMAQPEGSGHQWQGHLYAVRVILERFHTFVLQLNRRRGKRPGMAVDDEYDVQDILHALLKLHFKDVRVEEHVPSYLGSGSRMDFLLGGTGIVIEAKIARKGHADREIGTELIVDITRYAAHSECRQLICFIYDPDNMIVNAEALQTDAAAHPGRLQVEVIVSPMS